VKRYIRSLIKIIKSNPKKSLMIAALVASSLAPQYKPTIDAIVSAIALETQTTQGSINK